MLWYDMCGIIINVHNVLRRRLGELLTSSSELPFLAGLVFWLYYIVVQVNMLFLFIKTLKIMWHNAVHRLKKILISIDLHVQYMYIHTVIM